MDFVPGLTWGDVVGGLIGGAGSLTLKFLWDKYQTRERLRRSKLALRADVEYTVESFQQLVRENASRLETIEADTNIIDVKIKSRFIPFAKDNVYRDIDFGLLPLDLSKTLHEFYFSVLVFNDNTKEGYSKLSAPDCMHARAIPLDEKTAFLRRQIWHAERSIKTGEAVLNAM